SEPVAMSELLRSRLWTAIASGHHHDFQSALFQPTGGMGRIAEAFGRKLEGVIQYNAKVIEVHQGEHDVVVTYQDSKTGAAMRQARADWCVCTIPASVLGQIPMNVDPAMRSAIDALHYEASVKVGLQFKRRFWEEDESIFGGITYTDQPIEMIGYPNDGFFSHKGVLLGAYAYGRNAFELTSLAPAERVQKALEYGARIHPQYRAEFESGVAVAWHRVPWALGCSAEWTA